ncbi:MAG TPA: hypothetical protein VHX60_12790 [Acidobacteriaceae bacterium]|jgi:hypothetical protein|nr:hypothetical protein [Acidobacteriaceae bacterium]
MCLSAQNDNRRERWLISVGCLCLALSLASKSMNLTFGLSPSPLEFLRGVLLGLSLAMNLHVIWLRRRRNRQAGA